MSAVLLSEAVDDFLDADPRDAVVVYHAGCTDGLVSALVLWYLLGDDAVYIPFRHDFTPELDRFRHRNVVSVDFAWSRADTLRVKEVARSVLVLDHHISNIGALSDLDGCYFAPSGQCAARFVLGTFRDDLHHTVPLANLQWLIGYVEDRDLWRWELPDSRAINAALHLWPKNDFGVWDRRLRFDQTVIRERLCLEGDVLLQQADMIVNTLARGARSRDFCGYTALEVNSGVFWSELGEKLGTRADIVVMWAQQNSGQYRYELRSRNPEIDLAQLAAQFGGGGHRSAAGFYRAERV